MKDDLNNINRKLDTIADKMEDVRINVAKNTVDLAHHIKRTDLLEAEQTSFRDDLVSHVAKVKGAGILLATLVSIASIAGVLLYIVK